MSRPTFAERLAAAEVRDGCWIWSGNIARNGYGRYGARGQYAHRVAYELLVGPIPEGLTIDHLCRVHACVNPKHLEPVPLKVNILRGTSPPALHARRGRCARGHEFTHPGNQRRCTICHENNRRARRRANWPETLRKQREYRARRTAV